MTIEFAMNYVLIGFSQQQTKQQQREPAIVLNKWDIFVFLVVAELNRLVLILSTCSGEAISNPDCEWGAV